MQRLALGYLLALGGLAVAGPSGVLAWTEHKQQLQDYRAQIATLEDDREVLENRVELLDPNHADPDLVGELLRENLGVAHPDEIVVELDD